ncbi:hypothetical protein J1N35_023111 [Gossypium stocksii]|uniref:Reverse transcriptase zinc-binding domain-containing protein n=1 Tax=Gossypium stocksii TaxID=47602 RepID=A0A9D4A3K9_9ROSI|nr:hypothetical protein J1N35_023111 [Gossypium stocksii]
MSVFLAPKGVIDDMQTKISRVWWSGKNRGQFWSMLSWKNLCYPKGMGGLGFRDLHLFNLALLGRKVWRLINNKYTLCYQVLSSKYFPDGNIFNFKKVNRASFTWKSIVAAASVLKSGFGWQVGCGDRINIHTDNWGLEGLNGAAIKPYMLITNENSVRDLWHRESRRWNTCRVWELYGQDLGEKICSLPIGDENHYDRMVWFHNSLGIYNSKSAYSWLLLKQVGFGPHRFFWSADTLPKIRIFTWRVGNDILPANVKLASIHHGLGYNCPRCGADYETLIHALKDCPSSKATLMLGGLDSRVISKEYDRCIDWLEDMMRVLDKKAMADSMTILWNCWNSRNNRVFNGKEEEPKDI